MSRGLLARVILCLTLATTAALWHTPPAAAATYTISGTLSTPAGPLVVATVQAIDADFHVYYDNVYAADHGAFSFTAPEGAYSVQFQGNTSTVDGVSTSFTWNYATLNLTSDTDMGSIEAAARPVQVDIVDGHRNPPNDPRELTVNCQWVDEGNN